MISKVAELAMIASTQDFGPVCNPRPAEWFACEERYVSDGGGVLGEVGVDLVELGVDVLDGAGEVDVGAVGEGLDVPGQFFDAVAWDGGVEG